MISRTNRSLTPLKKGKGPGWSVGNYLLTRKLPDRISLSEPTKIQ